MFLVINRAGGKLLPPAAAGWQGRYRLRIGVTPPGAVQAELLYWQPKPLVPWVVWNDPGTEERIWAWLKKFHAAAEVILEIDRRLLKSEEVMT